VGLSASPADVHVVFSVSVSSATDPGYERASTPRERVPAGGVRDFDRR